MLYFTRLASFSKSHALLHICLTSTLTPSPENCPKLLKPTWKGAYKGLFTWRWGTPGRWGSTSIHIISHFNVIAFTWLVGWSPHVSLPTWSPPPLCKQALKVMLHRDNSQRRLIAQHSVATLFRIVTTLSQHCNAMLALKQRRMASSKGTAKTQLV